MSEEADQRAAHVEDHLHDIGPDHGSHATFEGVEQREADDQRDRDQFAGLQNDRDDDGDSKHANAFGERAKNQEGAGSEFSDCAVRSAAASVRRR